MFKMSTVRHRRGSRSIDADNVVEQQTISSTKNVSFRDRALKFLFIFSIGFFASYFRQKNDSSTGDPLTTPFNSKLAVKSVGDMDRFWGSYRSGFYLGMKTRSKNSLISGLMWMNQYVHVRNIHGII